MIDIPLQLPSNHTPNLTPTPRTQPSLTIQFIIPLLIQHQLLPRPQSKIMLPILRQIRRLEPCAVALPGDLTRRTGRRNDMQQCDHALADQKEYADGATSTLGLGDVLVAATELAVAFAADGLRAEDVAAEEAERWICEVLAGCWAATLVRQV